MNNEKTFLEKHPILNIILSFVVLIFVLFISYAIIRYLITEFQLLINAVSKLDAVIIVALITGTVTILTSIISKIIDYKKSKNEYLAQKREKPYEDFIDMFYKINRNINEKGSYSREDINKDMFNINRQLTLWGSKEVVKKWIDFRKHCQLNDLPSNKLLVYFEDIMNQMRKDMGTKRVEKGNIIGFVINDITEIKRLIR